MAHATGHTWAAPPARGTELRRLGPWPLGGSSVAVMPPAVLENPKGKAEGSSASSRAGAPERFVPCRPRPSRPPASPVGPPGADPASAPLCMLPNVTRSCRGGGLAAVRPGPPALVLGPHARGCQVVCMDLRHRETDSAFVSAMAFGWGRRGRRRALIRGDLVSPLALHP